MSNVGDDKLFQGTDATKSLLTLCLDIVLHETCAQHHRHFPLHHRSKSDLSSVALPAYAYPVSHISAVSRCTHYSLLRHGRDFHGVASITAKKKYIRVWIKRRRATCK